eukprot:2401631-Prymnesium_polylepis.1
MPLRSRAPSVLILPADAPPPRPPPPPPPPVDASPGARIGSRISRAAHLGARARRSSLSLSEFFATKPSAAYDTAPA